MKKTYFSIPFAPRTALVCCIATFLALTGGLAWKTWQDLRPLPASLRPQGSAFHKAQFLDRNGMPLSVTYTQPWNIYDWLPLHEIPTLLQEAFLVSEDQRFYKHHGTDWVARGHALVQNIRAFKAVRGASTVTEQVVRLLHPRPRTLWSRWLEGFEAGWLEKDFPKLEILEFYLNQVPYARQRRGVIQAARLYFDRDLDTLNSREMLALAVLVRAPDRMDPRHGTLQMEKPVQRLADHLHRTGKMSDAAYDNARDTGWSLAESKLPVDAGHFVRHVSHCDSGCGVDLSAKATAPSGSRDPRNPSKPAASEVFQAKPGTFRILTTLDSSLQQRVQDIVDRSLKDLREKEVADGAVLVVDHHTDEILAWVNGGGGSSDFPGGWIDTVTMPRQPGSTLKPFLYAMALDMGWTPSTLIEDSPLVESVGFGLHPFRNYSRKYHGVLRLREALGNSLNIPAVRTIQFTGAERFLERLHDLGFQSLTQPATHYGEGLALGNGEVTLLELVRAYTVLARNGLFRPLRHTLGETPPSSHPARRIFSSEAASLVADILSDPQARRLEFGTGNILRFPVQTAVKTGTSNDHRDAWAVGFSHRHTVGIWMGNLDRKPTGGITGTTGPGLILRAVFSELNRFHEASPLYLSPRLAVANICRETGLRATVHCPTIEEKFAPGSIPRTSCALHGNRQQAGKPELSGALAERNEKIRLLQPTPNLQMAMDPHIPDALEAFPLTLSVRAHVEQVQWIMDGKISGVTGPNEHRYLWPLSRGVHFVQARVWRAQSEGPSETPEVRFIVK